MNSTALPQTIAQKAQYQRATLIARLAALDPARVQWTVWDAYADLLATFFYLHDKSAK